MTRSCAASSSGRTAPMERGDRPLVLDAHAQDPQLARVVVVHELPHAFSPRRHLGAHLGARGPRPEHLHAVHPGVRDPADAHQAARLGHRAARDARHAAVAAAQAPSIRDVISGTLASSARCTIGARVPSMSQNTAPSPGASVSGLRASVRVSAVGADTRRSMPRMSTRLVRLGVIATIAGAFSGLFGIGGGTVIVPLLILWLSYKEREATGTSLAAICLIAAFGALRKRRVRQRRRVEGPPDRPARRVRRPGGHRPSAARAGAGAQRPVRSPHGGVRGPARALSTADIAATLAVGFAAGMASGLLGIGGGLLFVPGLVLILGETQLRAEATSLLAIIPVAWWAPCVRRATATCVSAMR